MLSLKSRLLGPLREHIPQARHRMRLRMRYLLHRKHPRLRVLVLSEPRTGSTLMMDYLNCIPGVTAVLELWAARGRIGLRRNWISKRAALRHLDYSLNLPGEIVAGKLMLQTMRWHSATIEDLDRHFPNARYIVLYRQNMAQQYVSEKIVMLTGIWRQFDGRRYEGKVRVERDEFIEHCRLERELFTEVVNSPAVRERGIVCSYEELSSDPQALFEERIFPLLEVEPVTLATKMQKQNVRPLAEMVENYDEVKDLLEGEMARHYYGPFKASRDQLQTHASPAP
jgi:LPS sulfotransferase NodH